MRAPRTPRRGPSPLRTALLALGLVACGGSDPLSIEDTGSTSSTAVASTGSVDPTTGVDLPATTTSDESSTGTSTTTSTSTATASTSETTTEGTSETTDAGGDTTGTPVIPGPKVKIISFNIRVGTANDGENAWDKRKGIVFDFLGEQDADVIGMQEDLRFQLLAIDDAVTGYKRVGVGAVDGTTSGEFNAIYYKKDRFSLDAHDTFWLSDTPGKAGSKTWGNDHPRSVTWARLIEKDSGYGFYVFNTHLDHISQNSREKSAVLLARRVADRDQPEPFVVTGDFNAAEGNLAIRYLKADAKIGGDTNAAPMVDTFRIFKPDATAVGTAHGFNGGTGGNKIDYVFTPPDQTVINAYISHYNVDGRYPSDHFPVVGVVRFADKD